MSFDIKVEKFSELLDYYPASFSGNRLNLLFVDDAEPIDDGQSYLHRLDAPLLVDERREYLIDERSSWPFPRFNIEDRPDPWLISERLLYRFEYAKRFLPVQADLAAMIESQTRRHLPDVVALVIVDGLSYYDLPDSVGADPCLVDGLTDTRHGYRQVVGKPNVSRRLFTLGYRSQFGFTYFADSNELAQEIHSTFTESQLVRVRSFDEILVALAGENVYRGYIQITLAGLDHLSHAHPDRPLREAYVRRICECYEKLVAFLSSKVEQALVILTADHGILWREHLEGRLKITDDLLPEDIRAPRYLRGSLPRSYGRVCRCMGQNYTLLGFPWMTRAFRNNEWGVHGGISAWESIVPLLVRRT